MEYDVKKQIGNFIVAKLKDDNGFDYIKIETIGGDWGINYRFDHEMFAHLNSDDLDWVDPYTKTLSNVSSVVDPRFNGAFLSFLKLLEYRTLVVGGLVKPDRKLSKLLMDSIDFYAKLLIGAEQNNDNYIEEQRLKHEVEEELRKLENGEEGKADV